MEIFTSGYFPIKLNFLGGISGENKDVSYMFNTVNQVFNFYMKELLLDNSVCLGAYFWKYGRKHQLFLLNVKKIYSFLNICKLVNYTIVLGYKKIG